MNSKFAAGTITFCFLCICYCSDESSAEMRIGFSLIGGYYPDPTEISFACDYPDVEIKDVKTYGLGINFGPVDFLYSTQIDFSLSYYVFHMKSNKSEFYPGSGATAQYKWDMLPVHLYAELYLPKKLSPYLKFGVGATSIYTKRFFNRDPNCNLESEFWAFSLSYGAGIRYSLSKVVDLSLFVEFINAMQDEGVNSDGYGNLYDNSEEFGLGYYGCRIRVWL